MKRILTSLLMMTVCGCQTAQVKAPVVIRSSKETVSIRVDKHFDRYEVDVQQADYRLDGKSEVVEQSKEVLSAPKVTGAPNNWMLVNIGETHKGLDYKISFLIDGEMVEMPALAGVNLIAKTTPLDGNNVRVKGIFASLMFDENRQLTGLSLPFDAVCTLGEKKVLYEKETKLEPIKQSAVFQKQEISESVSPHFFDATQKNSPESSPGSMRDAVIQ